MQTAESHVRPPQTIGVKAVEPNVSNWLAAEMKAVSSAQKCTKRTAVRLAISNAIQANILKPGDYLPPELAMTKIMQVSLGTIQAALQQLQDLNVIIRRRGDGTRVASSEPIPDSIWHFRFLTKGTSTPLRAVEDNIRLETVTGSGVWSDHLAQDGACYRIIRQFGIPNGNRFGSELLVPCTNAKELENTDITELQMINKRPFLEGLLNQKITAHDHVIATTVPDRATVETFQLSSRELHFEIHARTYFKNRTPAYYQRILVAVADCDLSF